MLSRPLLDRVAFFGISWYAILITGAIVIGYLLASGEARRLHLPQDTVIDFLLYAIPLGLICARLYYVAFRFNDYSEDLLSVFNIREGGMAIYGGVIGGLIAARLVSRKHKISMLTLLDVIAPALVLGQGIGRWGNFFNQEAFGTNTDTALFRMWSVKIRDTLAASSADLAAKGVTVDPEVPVHPTFLYESLWCVLGFLILNYIVHKRRSFKGEIFVLYGVWYGVERMVVEGMRTDSLYIGSTSIRVSQVLSAVIAVVALVYFIVVMVKKKQGRLPQRLRVVPVEELPPRPTKEERRAAQAAKRSKTKNKGVNEEKNGTDH